MTSRFNTTRVRPLASAARIVSSTPMPISWRRESNPSTVPRKSREIRAGSSMVNASGSGAGPDNTRRNSIRLPGRARTSISLRLLPMSCAIAAHKLASPRAATQINRIKIWPAQNVCLRPKITFRIGLAVLILKYSQTPSKGRQSLSQSTRRPLTSDSYNQFKPIAAVRLKKLPIPFATSSSTSISASRTATIRPSF